MLYKLVSIKLVVLKQIPYKLDVPFKPSDDFKFSKCAKNEWIYVVGIF